MNEITTYTIEFEEDGQQAQIYSLTQLCLDNYVDINIKFVFKDEVKINLIMTGHACTIEFIKKEYIKYLENLYRLEVAWRRLP